MDLRESSCRLIGDYILGPKIGLGSFAVVWRSRHRHLGLEVAVKEIDKMQLRSKVNDSLLMEITILRNINHPNIIRLHEVIETADKIYLVLEYCVGGDLASYIQHFGRVSELVARHFMRQLAAGLQVLRENNLIHRDLKPHNLLLSSNDETPVLKIGDFGFARYLTPHGLADTLCGSPLYMAPEIIQNQKYDAKADLWSVGAILFQLLTGKPPFDGNNQFQLFKNILASNELQFPQDVLQELHPDCVDLCKSLLRLNPVERLTFEEFFNHKFMAEPRPTMCVEYAPPAVESKGFIEQREGFTHGNVPSSSDKTSQLDPDHSSNRSQILISCSFTKDGNMLPGSTGSTVCDSLQKSVDGNPARSSDLVSIRTGSVDQGPLNMNISKVSDSLENIELEYVFVNAHFASMGTLSSSLEASMQDGAGRLSTCTSKKAGKVKAVPMQPSELASTSACGVENFGSHGSAPLAALRASAESWDAQSPSSLHPSTRLRLLHQYVDALSELTREKLNAGLHLESFSVELVALAIWKEAFHVCKSWVASSTDSDSHGSSSLNACAPDKEGPSFSPNLVAGIDFSRSASVRSWAEQGFIVAFDRAEKISNYLRDMDGSTEMPDAMEIIFQTALAAGKNGAEDELMGKRASAKALYLKATVLLSFVLAEAPLLPINPRFSLSVPDQQRIQRYILYLKAHQKQPEMLLSSSKQNQDYTIK